MWWIKCQAKEYTAYNDVHSKNIRIQSPFAARNFLHRSKAKSLEKGNEHARDGSLFAEFKPQCCHCPVSFEQWVQQRLKWCSRCRLKIWWDKFPIHFWCRALGFICESLGHCQDPYQQSIHGSRSIFVSITVIIAKQGQRFVMLPKSPSNICCLVVVRLKDFVFKVIALQYICSLHDFYFDSLVGDGLHGRCEPTHIWGRLVTMGGTHANLKWFSALRLKRKKALSLAVAFTQLGTSQNQPHEQPQERMK